MENEQKRLSPTLVIGIAAVVIGTLFLLGQFSLLNPGKYIRFWPVILIVIGVSGLLQPVSRGKIVGSGMTTLIGTMLLLMNLNYVNWRHTWPILIIGFGALLVWEALRNPSYLPSAEQDVRASSVFSAVEKLIVAQDFKEGTAEAVFGSVEIDFSHAEMTGEKALLNANAIFGSIEIRTPAHWAILVEANAVFGSCENKTRPPLPAATPKTLIIRGDAMFGSIEVKN